MYNKKMYNIGIVILASGYSRRMKENKLLMNINGKIMIQHILDMINNLEKTEDYFYSPLVVSRFEEIKTLSKKYKIDYIHNENAHLGQSQAVILGTKYLEQKKVDGIIFLPADMINLKSSSIKKMVETFINSDKETVIRAGYENIPSAPNLFPKKYFEDLKNIKGDSGGKQIIKKYTIVNIPKIEMIDIDTQNDI